MMLRPSTVSRRSWALMLRSAHESFIPSSRQPTMTLGEEQLNGGVELNESQAAAKFKEFRSELDLFRELSFTTASSTGPNAASLSNKSLSPPQVIPPRGASNPILLPRH
ncbi:hypothetical protein EDB19DRAFT_351727 [Suillus lakei]|nr:hypothetical protein EDB19DRAFT_351727 [Suillus lakei]